jgi:D-alanine--D-alanine ligase
MVYNQYMSRIRVGVIRGGPSQEYEVSLKTGQHILNMLKAEPLSLDYTGVDILIDKAGIWHIDGFQVTPELAMRRVDVVFSTLKGEFGEDGKIQNMLELFSKPYVGSRAYASALSLNKGLSKEHFKKHGIKTPYHKELSLPDGEDLSPTAEGLFKTFPMPVVVKPRGQGSSLGVSFASTFPELIEALEHARGFSNEVIVEEYITGKEIISGFIEDFRGQDLYHMFPVEVHPHKNMIKLSDMVADKESVNVTVDDLSPEEKAIAEELVENEVVAKAVSEAEKLAGKNSESVASPYAKHPAHEKMFDWGKKYSGAYDHKSPSSLTNEEKETIKEIMSKIHKEFDLDHYATADFIVSPKRGVYILEVNTSPQMHQESPIYKSLEAGGVKDHQFIEHLIRLALKRGK